LRLRAIGQIRRRDVRRRHDRNVRRRGVDHVGYPLAVRCRVGRLRMLEHIDWKCKRTAAAELIR
jgi:hypothetical protein